jgi:hypothetical protein
VPIALLLEESSLLVRFGAKQLSPWVQLVAIEEVLIDRARSAFLVRWFGTRLPLRGSYLAIAIDNLVALRNRYLLAVASAKGEETGLNLTEPLASLGGEVVGFLSSPHGALLLGVALVRRAKSTGKKLVGVAVALGMGLLGAPLIIGLGTPIGLVGGLYIGTSDEDARAVVAFLGVFAKLLDALTLFLRQLLGPRDQVRNPIVRALLGLFDRLAGLGAQFLGFLSYAVVRLGPYLLPLAVQAALLPDLIQAAVATVTFILTDFFAQLGNLFDPKFDLTYLIRYVIVQLTILFPAISIAFLEVFQNIIPVLKRIAERIAPTFTSYFTTIQNQLLEGVGNDPFFKLIDVVLAGLDAAGDALTVKPVHIHIHLPWPIPDYNKTFDLSSSSSPSPPSKHPFPTFPKFTGKDVTSPADVVALLGPPPDLADIQKLAEQDLTKEPLYGKPLSLSPETLKAIERARNPPSVFAGEEAALTKQLGKAPALALADELGAQQKLRDLLTVVVGRILPPALRTYMGSVIGGFQSLDEALTLDPKKRKAKKSGADPDYPVRELRDNGQLLPVVHRLVIEAMGATKLTCEDFEDRLQRALTAQSYPAPSGP